MITLTRGLDVITLPNPVFSNTETLNLDTIIRFDMSGMPHTHKREPNIRLVFTFDYKDCTDDSIRTDLNTFIRNLGNLIMTDHKGQDWNVKITSTPIQWTDLTKDRSQFTLEFEGERSA